MPKSIFRTFSFLATSVFLAACGPLPSTGSEAGTEVIATVGMIADIAQNVAGSCATVTPLMGPGTDPHTYRAGARDSRTLGSANLILYAGYGLEGEFGDLLARIGERRNTLAVAEAAVPRSEVIATDDRYGVDPHLWMDVAL